MYAKLSILRSCTLATADRLQPSSSRGVWRPPTSDLTSRTICDRPCRDPPHSVTVNAHVSFSLFNEMPFNLATPEKCSHYPGVSPQTFEPGASDGYSEALYEGASARSRRADTVGLMLKSFETWGCRRGHLAMWCSAPPGTPGGSAPVTIRQAKLQASAFPVLSAQIK